MMSTRMTDTIIVEKGHIRTRITRVRLKVTLLYNIFFVVVYVPHNGRTVVPMDTDNIVQLSKLLSSIKKTDFVVLTGDSDCKLQRNVKGCAGTQTLETEAKCWV